YNSELINAYGHRSRNQSLSLTERVPPRDPRSHRSAQRPARSQGCHQQHEHADIRRILAGYADAHYRDPAQFRGGRQGRVRDEGTGTLHVVVSLETLLSELRAWSPLETAAAVLALAYLVLAARQNLWCWPCAFVSTAIYFGLFL